MARIEINLECYHGGFATSDLLNGRLTKKGIDGRIVIFGFLGSGEQDKFFSSLNTNSNEPDMYSLQYLANIVAQVLEYNHE